MCSHGSDKSLTRYYILSSYKGLCLLHYYALTMKLSIFLQKKQVFIGKIKRDNH